VLEEEEEDLEEVSERAEGSEGSEEEMGPEAMQMLMEPGIVLAEPDEEESMEEDEETGQWTISN